MTLEINVAGHEACFIFVALTKDFWGVIAGSLRTRINNRWARTARASDRIGFEQSAVQAQSAWDWRREFRARAPRLFERSAKAGEARCWRADGLASRVRRVDCRASHG